MKPGPNTQQDHKTPGDGKPGKVKDLFRWLVFDRLDRLSLSFKLVACTVILLLVGVAGTTLSIRQMVSKYLLDKTDMQLSQQADLVYSNVISLLRGKDTNQTLAGPTDYFLQVRNVDNQIILPSLVPVLKSGVISQPTLPPSGSSGGITLQKPFTTQATVTVGKANPDHATLQTANAPWRVLALSWMEKLPDGTTQVGGVVYIGLSLASQIDTVNTLTRYCTMVGIAIVLFGAMLAMLVIQHTLTPLKRIEKTAAKIAMGDLSQRVPAAPENTEVGSLAASLNRMLARIEQSFREQRETTDKMKRFVSDASHELRTPLAAIHGYAELYTMQRDLPGALERADASISHIETSSTRMTVLVEDLLSLARLDEGRGIDVTQQVPLTSMLNDAVDDLHALDPDRGISRGIVQLDRPQPGAPVRLRFLEAALPEIMLTGDGSRLRQVVTNIVGNIHRYTPADSPVEVGLSVMTASISADSLARMPATEHSLRMFLEAVEVGQSMRVGMNYAVISFIDHGSGVPAASQSQIFERFYTADPSRARQKGGTGLGMAIALSVVKAHHGFICATNSEGGGLTLTFVLPMEPVEPEPVAAPTSGKASKSKSKKQAKTAKQDGWLGRPKDR